METGAPLLDAQHRALVERAAALVDTLAAPSASGAVERALRSLGDYAVRHFAQDEDCAMRGNCPVLEWNGAARAELIGVMARFRSAYERDGAAPVVAEQLEREIGAWVHRYIPGPEPLTRPCTR